MVAGWSPPDHWSEMQLQLKQSGSVKLDASGLGVIIFTPSNARQRWQVTSVVVSTNQAANATVVPVAQVALNSSVASLVSQGNARGSSWSGNQDTFSGLTDVGPCDNLTVAFSPAPGQSGSAIAGVIAYAVVTGVSYTRRA